MSLLHRKQQSKFQSFQCIFINQNASNHPLTKKRKAVKQPFLKYPQKYMGKLLTYFTKNQDDQEPQQGTAFFVGEGILLTVAHNLCNTKNYENKLKHNNKYNPQLQTPKNIYFYPVAPKGKKQIRLQVKSYKIHPKYETCINEQYGPNIYDFALLQLDYNQVKKYKQFIPEGYLKINYDIQLKKNKRIQILAAGFPNQINKHPDACYMYQQVAQSIDQDFNYIYYKHQTTEGQSGMGLFQITKQNNYKLIGIHKAGMSFKSKDQNSQRKQNIKKFGLTFNQLVKQQIAMMAQQLKIEQRLKQNYQISKKQLLKQKSKQKNINQNHFFSKYQNKPIKKISYDSKYVNQLIDKKQFKQAFQLADQAVKKQCVQAYGDLARIYLQNVQTKLGIVVRETKKAFQLAKKGTDLNQSNAKYILGKCYYHGYEVKTDYKKAVQLYQSAIQKDNNNKYALNALGFCYFRGQGVEKDPSKAVYLYVETGRLGYQFSKNHPAYYMLENYGYQIYQNNQGYYLLK